MKTVFDNYIRCFGAAPESVAQLVAAGSPRLYLRCRGVADVVCTVGNDHDENRAFIALSRHFVSQGLPVPTVTGVSSDGMTYFQSDLGDVSLYSLMSAHGKDSELVWPLIKETIRLLPHFQFSVSDNFDWSVCFPCAAMDERSVMWDLNYFKYCFLKPSGLDFSEAGLEDDMAKLCGLLLSESGPVALMLRDFQSRNVMIHDGTPWLIDFQGARKGPVLYDVASFLWQARAGFDNDQRRELAHIYKCEAERVTGKRIERFESRLRLMALFRTLQVLGAYGFRGFVENKSTFITSIPAAIANLRELIDDELRETVPYLSDLLDRLVAMPRWVPESPFNGLTVDVISFSYKKGVPVDTSGNGGGFVFDCRAVHNPGRYDRYKPLTGMDREVIDFLEQDGEILEFLKSCAALADASVARYLKRGFSHLQVCFGCTGGRHRSVYSAEWMARHLASVFPDVRVVLNHREQNCKRIILPEI